MDDQQETQAMLRRMQVLAEASHVFAEASLDLQAALQVVTRHIATVLGDGCIIQLICEEGLWLIPASSYHTDSKTDTLLRSILVPRRVAETLHSQTTPSRRINVVQSIDLVYQLYLNQCGVHSFMVVPIHVRGRVIGTLTALRDQTSEAYTVDDQLLLQDLADRAGLVIDNARLFEAEQHARRRAEVLHAANLALTQSLELDTILESLLDFLQQLIPYDSASVLIREDDQHLRIYCSRGYALETSDASADQMVVDVRQNRLFQTLLSTKHSLQVIDTASCPDWEGHPLTTDVRGWMGIPLIAGGIIVGMYSVDSRLPGAFTQQHLELAEALASQAAVALQNSQLFTALLHELAERERTEYMLQEAKNHLEMIVEERTEELLRTNQRLSDELQERERIELALRENMEHLRAVFEFAPIGVVNVDHTVTPIRVNRALQEMLGYTEAELRTISFLDITHPDDLEQSRSLFRNLVEGKHERYTLEKRYFHKDGHIIWGRLSIAAIRDESGKFLYSVSMIEDITERKRAEQALRESEARLNLILAQLPALMCVTDREYRITSVSGQNLAPLRAQPRRIIGKTLYDVFKTHDPNFLPIATHRRVMQTGEAASYEYGWEGRTFHIYVAPFLDMHGHIEGTLSLALDITERKQVEESLQRTTILQDAILDSANYTIIATNPAGTILTFNEAAERLLGYRASEVIGRATPLIIHDPNELEQRIAELADELNAPLATGFDALVAMARRGEVEEREWTYIRKDGSRFPVLLSVSALRDDQGQITGFLAIGSDITERKRAARRLEEQTSWLRAQAQLLDLAHDTIMVRTLDGTIIFWNYGAEQMYGWTREEAVGSISHTLLNTQFPAPLEHIHEQLLADGYWEGELRHTRQDGTHLIVSSRWAVRRNERGEPSTILEIDNDISERKRLEEMLRLQNRELIETTNFLNNILDSSTEYSIIPIDLNGLILDWNVGALRNYGYTADEMIGKQPMTVLHRAEDVDLGRVRAVLAHARRNGQAEAVFEAVRKNSSRFVASLTVTLRRDADGTPIGYLVISKDITMQKRLEEELQRKNWELEEQNRRISEANRLKSEFVANMSHELRTPLNAIFGFAELMHDERVGPVSEEQKEYLGDILASANHLLQLINDILDLSKVEAGVMEFRPEVVRIGKLISEVRDILRTITARKHLKLETVIAPDLKRIVIDPARFKQILYNYLSNAIKFTPDGGKITIRVEPEGEDHFRVEVEDTGIGIAPDDLSRLFIEFQQLDSGTAKKHQGTGLGLALTKQIVEAQGGMVGVRSVLHQGSVFYAILPRITYASSVPTNISTVHQSHVETQRGPLILVIDDDLHEQAFLVQTLLSTGYRTVSATTGAEALRQLDEQAVDAVILDLLLPDMGGWEVLRSIRTAGRNSNIPVIIATIVSEQEAGVGFAINDFLTKPFAADDLTAALERAGLRTTPTPTILVIEDDFTTRKLATSALEQAGYRVLWAGNGAEALQLARAEQPAAVVLDLLLPKPDGLEFLYEFHRALAGQPTPVIIWTNKDLSAAEEQHLRQLARAIISKSEGGAGPLVDEINAIVPDRAVTGATDGQRPARRSRRSRSAN